MAGFTPNAGHMTNYSLAAAQHFGIKMQVGTYLEPALGTYTTVGDPVTIYGMPNPKMIMFGNEVGLTALITDTDVYRMHVYDVSNETVRIISSTYAAAFTTFSTVSSFLREVSTTFAGTTLAVPYLAIGW